MSDDKGQTAALDRREFFRRGLQKGAQMVIEEAEARVESRARRWIRPPFALPELDFLLACTRCGACIEACPHYVIFSLPPRVGLTVASTPALDLSKKGCRLCDDWPCVVACTPGALACPAPDCTPDPTSDPASNRAPNPTLDPTSDDGHNCAHAEPGGARSSPLPHLTAARIDERRCLPYAGPECGACAYSCPIPGALLWDGPKPRIDPELCVGCAMCREACITEPKAIVISHP